MPIPNNITDLNATPSLNSPPGPESITTLKGYLQALSAFIRQLLDADNLRVAKSGDTMTGNLLLSGSARIGAGGIAQYARVDSYFDGVGGINPNKSYYAMHWGSQTIVGLGLNSSGRLVVGASDVNSNLTSFNLVLGPDGPVISSASGTTADPYGRISVTMPGDANAYNYFAMTRSGQIGCGIGINALNQIVIGGSTSGTSGTINAPYINLDAARVSVPTRLETPAQPSFFASSSGGIVTNNSIFIFSDVQHNRGSAYNAATGRFTCPAGGLYSISWAIDGQATASQSPFVNLFINGTVFCVSNMTQRSASTVNYFSSGCVHLTLAIGDVVDIRISNIDGAGFAPFSAFKQTRFSMRFEG